MRRSHDQAATIEPEDSYSLMLKGFRERNLALQPIIALCDRPTHPAFKAENEKLKLLNSQIKQCYLPKGNPFSVSQNSEVLMVKERAKLKEADR